MLIGVSITKKFTFRGTEQEFSNTYFYKLITAVTAPSESIVDEITAKEKTFHHNGTTFVKAAVWTAGGSKAENQMIFAKNLSGTGTQGTVVGADRERAVLVRIRAGVDTRGLPVYLRKWYHSMGIFAGTTFASTTHLENTGQLASTARAAIASAVDALKAVAGGAWSLCGPTGRNPGLLEGFECHPYWEHHQLGDMWRG